MIDGQFVLDAVAHGYSQAAENQVDRRYGETTARQLYGMGAHYVPEGYLLPFEQWTHATDPDLVASALFAESPTDMAVYHEVPMFGAFRDGGSPLWVGQRMRERWPHRVALFGAVSPFLPDPRGQVDRKADLGVIGLKLYPFDFVAGRATSFRLDDPELAFPIFERALERGIRHVAVHKALPLGPVPLAPFGVCDVESAAVTFPDITFEIVHGGMAFLEETTWQLARFPNVVVNLEGTSVLAVRAPRQLAQVIGSFLLAGAAERILWATGCMAVHPKPFVEAFWRLEMPTDLMEGYGMPPLTAEVKAGILGGNAARLYGVDIQTVTAAGRDDEFGRRSTAAPPWSRVSAVAA
jgi:hypothetical protein